MAVDGGPATVSGGWRRSVVVWWWLAVAVGGGPVAAWRWFGDSRWWRVVAEGNKWWVVIGVIWSFHIEKYSHAMEMLQSHV